MYKKNVDELFPLIPSDKVIQELAQERRDERRFTKSEDYTIFHELYTTAVSLTDYSENGTYQGPYVNTGTHGPTHLPIPSLREQRRIRASLKEAETSEKSSQLGRRRCKRKAFSKKNVSTSSLKKARRGSDSSSSATGMWNSLADDSKTSAKAKTSSSATSKQQNKTKKIPKAKEVSKKKKIEVTRPMTGESIPRGVTVRPSGRWQAQFYFGGRSRYIGVFDSFRHAAVAYNYVRKELYAKRGSVHLTSEQASRTFNEVRNEAMRRVKEEVPSGTDPKGPKGLTTSGSAPNDTSTLVA